VPRYVSISPAPLSLSYPGIPTLLGAPRSYEPMAPQSMAETPLAIPEDAATFSNNFIGAATLSKHQYAAFLAALSLTTPTYSFSEDDVVITRDMLRQLYTFASGRIYSKYTGFDLSIEVVGNTVFVSRGSMDALERVHGIHPDHTRGYSFNFINRTTNLLQGFEKHVFGTGWQRAIRYSLGDLKLVVLCDIDACRATDPALAEFSTHGRSAEEKSHNSPHSASPDLPSALSSLNIADTTTAQEPTSRLGITVYRAGPANPQPSHCVDIRTAQTRYQLYNYVSKLYFGRQSHVIVGLHGARGRQDRGAFFDVADVRAGNVIRRWERSENTQTALRKLVALLQRFRAIAEEKGRCSVKSKVVNGRLVAQVRVMAKQKEGEETLAEMVEKTVGSGRT